MQEVSWGPLSTPTPAGGVREAGWGKGEGDCHTVLKASADPKGTCARSSVRWPYRVGPNRGEGQGRFTPQKLVVPLPWEGWDLGQEGSLQLRVAGGAGRSACD